MRISTGCLVLCVVGGISCKTQKDLESDTGGVALDSPGWGELLLNIQVEGFSNGPAQHGKAIEFVLEGLDIVHRIYEDDVLLPPEIIPVVVGPLTMSLPNPHDNSPKFAGRYWLPPGEVQRLELFISDAEVITEDGAIPILLPHPEEGWATFGVVEMVPDRILLDAEQLQLDGSNWDRGCLGHDRERNLSGRLQGHCRGHV